MMPLASSSLVVRSGGTQQNTGPGATLFLCAIGFCGVRKNTVSEADMSCGACCKGLLIENKHFPVQVRTSVKLGQILRLDGKNLFVLSRVPKEEPTLKQVKVRDSYKLVLACRLGGDDNDILTPIGEEGFLCNRGWCGTLTGTSPVNTVEAFGRNCGLCTRFGEMLGGAVRLLT